MLRILKYPLTDVIIGIANVHIIKFLDIQEQFDTPTLWCLVDDDAEEKYDYLIYKLGTGWKVTSEETANYIATSQDKGFVWHWFWQIRK